MNKERLKGELLLLTTALIWGLSFVSQKVGMTHIGPFSFSMSRLLLGALVLIPVIFMTDRLGVSDGSGDKKRLWYSGTLCGLMIFGGISLQQYGLQFTTVGKSAFITALYILLVPLIGFFFFRNKVGKFVWLGVVIGTVGLYFLTMKGSISMEKGDFLMLIGSIFWSMHILLVEKLGADVDGVRLSAIQFFVAGILSLAVALPLEKPTMHAIGLSWAPLLFSGVVVVGVAYTLQIFGQRSTPSHIAALIMSLESVFAVLAGYLFLSEVMTLRELFGCALMFGAIILAQIPDKHAV